jgi:hypothetical protein
LLSAAIGSILAPTAALTESEGIAHHPRFRFQAQDVVPDSRQVVEAVAAPAMKPKRITSAMADQTLGGKYDEARNSTPA